MERAAVADGDAGDLRAVAHNQRETERIVAVRGRVQDVYAVEVHAFNVKVNRYAKTVADGVISFERVGSCKCAHAQSEEHHNCQKDCCELFHSSSSYIVFSRFLFARAAGMPYAECTFCIPLLPCAFEKRLYLTAEQLAAKYMLTHYRSSIVSCAPTRPCVDHVFRFLGALLSSRRFPGNSILSCCSYSVVGAYRLLLGRAKARWFRERGFPGSVFPRRAGETRCAGIGALAVSPRGMGPVYLQIRSHADRIRYSCEAFSAFGTDAGDCACASRRASFFAAFFAACSCRNCVSWRWYSCLNSGVFRGFQPSGNLMPRICSAFSVRPVIFSSSQRSARNRRPFP